jgi:hypothetical protein
MIDDETDSAHSSFEADRPGEEDREPDVDDTVHCCPDCERPNQFGELCDECRREREIEAMEDRRERRLEGDDIDFADPGGRSALRAATEDNPRNLPCPHCGKADRLTPADRALGYQCDECADRTERGVD